jgi:IMP cyclohydrolase
MEIASKLSNGATYIDALVEYAKENDLEIETVAEIVKKSSILKEKIREEAVAVRMVKKEDNGFVKLC